VSTFNSKSFRCMLLLKKAKLFAKYTICEMLLTYSSMSLVFSRVLHERNLISSSMNFSTECHGWMLATDGWFLLFLVGLFEDAVDMAFENLYEIAAKHTWTEKAKAPGAIRYAGNGLQFSEWRITSGEKRGMLAISISFLYRTLMVFFPVRGISGGQKPT